MATNPSASADYGADTYFSSGQLTVSTQGMIGVSGPVASSADVKMVNASGQEVFTAANLASSCTASGTAIAGSTTITNGTLQTSEIGPVVVSIPANPAPNTMYNGTVDGDNFTYVFNEQIFNLDGSLTVNAARQTFLGPTVVGEVIIGRSACGATGTPIAHPMSVPETMIDSGPSGTIASKSPSFRFSSSETGSTFGCALDGPGAAIGSFEPCSSPKDYSALLDGEYTFSVRATNSAGNTDPSPATRAFAVDTQAPKTTIRRRAVNDAKDSARFRFASSESESSFRCKLDRRPSSRCNSPKTYRDLEQGMHVFRVKAIDAPGNVDPTAAVARFRIRD